MLFLRVYLASFVKQISLEFIFGFTDSLNSYIK